MWLHPNTYVHGKDTSGDELSVLPDAEVPCLYPHHVVKHELQVQPALYAHLEKARHNSAPVPTD